MKRRLHPLPTFSYGLVAKTYDLDAHLAGGNHDLHVDWHHFDAVESDSTHM